VFLKPNDHSQRVYLSLVGAMKRICQEEGLKVMTSRFNLFWPQANLIFCFQGFWKGNLAGEWLYMTYMGIQFLIYDHLKVPIDFDPPFKKNGHTLSYLSTPFFWIHERNPKDLF